MKTIDIQCKHIIDEIKKVLKLQHIDVCYDSKEEVCNRLLKGEHVVYLSVIDSVSEKEKYERKQESIKNSYKTKSPRIHFPDLSVFELIDTYKCGVEDEFSKTVNQVRNQISSGSDEYLFVAFLFLHEAGHWRQLYDVDRCVKKYTEQDIELERSIYNRQSEIYLNIKKRNSKTGEQIEVLPEEREQLYELGVEYRKIPKEADADEYALQQLKVLNLDEIESNLNNVKNLCHSLDTSGYRKDVCFCICYA